MLWETSLTRALTASTYEHINFQRAVEGQRIMFLPHSQGIFLALVLKQIQEIESDQLEQIKAFKPKDMNTTGISGSVSSSSLIKSDSSNTGNVKRLTIKNNLFLDVGSLSKNLQTILNSCQMIVIAKVKSVTKH
jgi:hypothetical protein